MSLILYIDTTTARLMLALGNANRLAATYTAPCESHRYHSAMLIPAVEDLLAQAGATPADLTALAVNHGPGSFTGIRTGVATARTMAQFLHLPVHVLNTFELLAAEKLPAAGPEGAMGNSGLAPALQQGAPVEIFVDALRGRAYHAVLRWEQDGPVYELPPALKVLEPGSVHVFPDARLLVSDGLAGYFEGRSPEWIAADWFSPERMRKLIGSYGHHFAVDWQAVKPLYIQEPNITLKKVPSPAN